MFVLSANAGGAGVYPFFKRLSRNAESPMSLLEYFPSKCTRSAAAYAARTASSSVSRTAVMPSTRPPLVTNSLLSGIALKVGSLSEKTERGRHTTRHTELIPVGNSGAVLDTPGFSLLDNIEIEPQEIKNCYPEFRAVRGECRFNGCIHVSEPGCAVKKGGENVISRGRYERYVHLVKEAEENKRNRF